MTVVYYHANCSDGMASAFACKLVHPDWTYTPINYDQEINFPPENKFFCDFCPTFEEIKKMAKDGYSITILDHHKTRQGDFDKALSENLIKGIFDLNRSGAGISYDYFKPPVPRDLFSIIESRDLWKFDVAGARELNAFLSKGLSFETLKEAMDDLPKAIELGKELQKQADVIVDKCCDNYYIDKICGVEMPVVNSPMKQSEICNKLLEMTGFPVSACWYKSGDMLRYSLRSIKEYDCSELAKKHGGGGHRTASGFSIKEGNKT